MSDEIKELEQELGLTAKVVLNPDKEEQQFKYLEDDAKDSMKQINEVISEVKEQIEALNTGVSEEGDRNKALSDMIDNYQKLMIIKQKYSTHLMDIYKRKKSEVKVTEEDGSTPKKGLTTTELKNLMEQEKRKESPVDF